MLSSYNRSVTTLRISVTDKCNLRCRYCMPEEGIELMPHSALLSFEAIEQIVIEAVKLGITRIRLTGGEPLVRRGVENLFRMLGAVEGIEELTLTTNGLLLKQFIPVLLESGVKRVNISLDTIDPDRYRELTRGGDLSIVIEAIRAARDAGLTVKLNQVVQPGTSAQEVRQLSAWAVQEEVSVQRIRFFRPDEDKLQQERQPHQTESQIQFDRPHPCESCNRIRLMADGVFKPCLHSEKGVKVNLTDIEESIREAVAMKPPCGSCSDLTSLLKTGG